jgi:hypothetical protein
LPSKARVSFHFSWLCVAFLARETLLVLQVSDLVEMSLGFPKDIHTTLKGPPRGLVAISQPNLSFSCISYVFPSFTCLLEAHSIGGEVVRTPPTCELLGR